MGLFDIRSLDKDQTIASTKDLNEEWLVIT
jgi:hypothetical protein